MSDKQKLLTDNGASLAEYFREQVERGARRLKPPPQDDTCWYLGRLLDRFSRSDQLFAFDQGRVMVRPLALLYKDALEAPTERDRCLLLQQLGDVALFVGALFPERYLKKGIDQSYFVGMGGGAYDYLAGNAPRNRHVFAELARTFARLLGLIAQACSREQPQRPVDVLALYERWLQTDDPWLAARLRALGIDPERGRLRH